MNARRSNHASRIGLRMVALLAVGTTAQSADKPTLKDAYKEHSPVGVAINRTIAMKAAVRADPKFHIFLCFGQSSMEAGARPEANGGGRTPFAVPRALGACHRSPIFFVRLGRPSETK